MSALVQPATHTTRSLVLIGMAGAGKSTLGKTLARTLGFAHVDTDHLLEAWWGMDLQTLADTLSREQFLNAEARLIQSLDIRRAVISTGGSVIYDPASVAHLKELGICIYLKAQLSTIEQRIAQNPLRGLAMAPGQSIKDLYREREALYEQAADMIVRTDTQSVQACVATILDRLPAPRTDTTT
ncbi:homoserine kinase [Desulfoplanes formicivorans]|uniref:Shikimate kinase n=1 Tax=Desulfoplanes formicivorans TaxID=1592317 RepID=A0A194AJE2_9BACT|nr:homoserine kinase [Desulfoplanes formicivorans]GAU09176.1 shikimate kinase [Desulfoplanes formicivorans]